MDDNSAFFESEEAIGFSHDTELYEQKKAQNSLYKKLAAPNTDFDFRSWMKEFDTFSQKYDRFLYSQISSEILRETSEDTVTFVMSNVKTIIEKIQRDSHNEKDYSISYDELNKPVATISQCKYKLLIKLYDHCNLANTQRAVYNRTKQDIGNLTDETIKQKVGEYEKDITTQLISLVSIFTALSFVIFGGISVLDNLLQNVKNLPFMKILLIGDLWFICMSNIFLLFTKFICIMIKRNFDWKWRPLILNVILLVIIAIILISGKSIYGTYFFL